MKGMLYTALCFIIALSTYGQKVHTARHQNWVNGNWQDSLLITYTYDNQGLLVNKLEQTWSATNQTWINKQQNSFTSKNNGTLKEDLTQLWDTVNKTWQNSVMATEAYNSVNQLSVSLTHKWINGNWQNSGKKAYAYDDKGFLTRQLEQSWSAANQTWVNAVLFNFSNTQAGTMTMWIDCKWDSIQKSLQKVGRNTIAYNAANKPTGNVSQHWRKGHWHNNVRGLNYYDANGFLVKSLGQVWDSQSKTYINGIKYSYTLSASGAIENETVEKWKKADGSLIGKQQVSYAYL